jgi:FixJ family two-component response regulator
VVDDDASVRRGIGWLMRSHGFVCIPFESGEKAVATPEIGEADCLILDIQLSGIDGFKHEIAWKRGECIGRSSSSRHIRRSVHTNGGAS